MRRLKTITFDIRRTFREQTNECKSQKFKIVIKGQIRPYWGRSSCILKITRSENVFSIIFYLISSHSNKWEVAAQRQRDFDSWLEWRKAQRSELLTSFSFCSCFVFSEAPETEWFYLHDWTIRSGEIFLESSYTRFLPICQVSPGEKLFCTYIDPLLFCCREDCATLFTLSHLDWQTLVPKDVLSERRLLLDKGNAGFISVFATSGFGKNSSCLNWNGQSTK